MEDYLSDIKKIIDKLESLNGQVMVKDGVESGTNAQKMQLPLSKRLSQTNEEAMDRARLEANQRDTSIEDDGPEHDDGVADAYADEIFEKILRNI